MFYTNAYENGRLLLLWQGRDVIIAVMFGDLLRKSLLLVGPGGIFKKKKKPSKSSKELRLMRQNINPLIFVLNFINFQSTMNLIHFHIIS